MENIATERRYVGTKETILYGVANGGQCIGYNLVRAQLTFFLVTVCRIPAAAVATMVLIMGTWDTLNDPLMGSIVDRTRTRYGKLRPYLLFVPIPLSVVTILLFSGGELLKDVKSTAIKIAFMYISYFLWEFFYTIGDIPFWGLSAAISPSPSDRSRVITSARLISGIIGGIVGIGIPLMIDLSNNNIVNITLSQVFLIFGVLAGTLGTGLFALSGICTKERVVQSTKEEGLFTIFKALKNNKPLLLIVIANTIATVGGIGGVFTQYYYIYSLGFASLTIVAGIPGTVVSLLAFLFIPKIEKVFSSKQVVIFNAVLNAVVGTLVFVIGSGSYTNPRVIVPLLAVSGIFTSFTTSLNAVIPTKMIGDTVDYVEWKTGERNEGITFSFLTFISKLTGSFSTAIATFIMPLIGLQSIDNEWQLVDSGVNTRLWLWALITIIPHTLNLLSLIPYIFYKLDGKTLAKIQYEINIRRLEKTAAVSSESKTD
ncbi:MAG: glycoside-pentoside-hexuronide (GPH):cation symporter [Clostridia bacterium]|nr:glycoside-pentoside-hexuronide (GPH):cation symporter [Clostridia bacterium]